MTDRPPINKRPQMHKSSLGATIRNTGMSTRHIYEMQVNTANYEAMMQRFQLRKVSDTGLITNKFQAKDLVIDKESGGVKKKSRHQTARFSLQRLMRSLTKWKTWRKFLLSLSSPITPTSRISTMHGIIMLCTYHFQLFYLPFGPSYYPQGSPGITGINIALEVIFSLNLLLNFNTAYRDQSKLVTSRKLIASNYLNKWFIVDFLSATPRFGIQFFLTGSLTDNTPAIVHSETALMMLRVLRITFLERTILLSRVVRISKHMVAWLRYSRYSHLLGIAQLMWLVLLIAHYMACLWHVVSHHRTRQTELVVEKYIADYYYAVSLIQGQGNIVGTRDENLYSTVAILVGSVVLAIVFGNVAMLVSNFNASSTNYHRKMEAVFATMDKMKLPDKLRDRIHQYYTHVWTEYESLDCDIVKFQRELTHTLGLEVGLYKYMNLVTEIPFWKDCSPDFATQIILNLAVRVYLPDDYVVRKGETSDEMFMINRGICALSYTWETDSDSDSNGDGDSNPGDTSSSSQINPHETSRLVFNRHARGSAKFKLHSDSKTVSTGDSASLVRPQQYRAPGDVLKTPSGTATDRSTESAENCETQLMYPGETAGEMGLIMNHMQPGSIRAVTYVEMCILDRNTFQRLISRYPADRRTVLTYMLRDSIEKAQFPFSWEELSEVVLHHRQRKGDLGATIGNVHSTLTPAQAAQALVERMDVTLLDKTIFYGLQGSEKPLELQLPAVQAVTLEKPSPVRENGTRLVAGSLDLARVATPPGVSKDDKNRDELLEMMRAMTGAISRIENDLTSMKTKLDQLYPAVTPPNGDVTSAILANDAPCVARRALSLANPSPPDLKLKSRASMAGTNIISASAARQDPRLKHRPPPKTKRLSRVKSMIDVSATENDSNHLDAVSCPLAPIKPLTPVILKRGEDLRAEADQAESAVVSSSSTALEMNTSSYTERLEPIKTTLEPPTSSSINAPIEARTRLFDKAQSQRVVIRPQSRLSIVDGASRPHRSPKQRPSIRRLLSSTFSRQPKGPIQPGDSSSGRSRGAELTLADQLWSRQSSENKVTSQTHNYEGIAMATSERERSAYRGGSARSARSYKRDS